MTRAFLVCCKRSSLAGLALIASFVGFGCDSEAGNSEEEMVGDEDAHTRPSEAQPPSDAGLCDQQGETRECMNGEGTMFCVYGEAALEGHWGECLVDFTCMPGDVMTSECINGPADVLCELSPDGVPYWGSCPFTPLVLNFEPGAAIELAPSFAAFDIAGVGECLDSDWPSAATPWLVADLDRNGFIDGGHELFGSGTILESGRHARDGFVALAPFDGNHDGRITAADPRFAELLVWRDEDADKHSLPFELHPLADEGVQAIELNHDVLEQCDARGNCGRERSRFEYSTRSGQTAVGEVVDIHLACE